MAQSAASNRVNAAVPIIFVTMSLAIGYAILRYHVLGDVPWKDFPFFILNKGLSFGAFILITLNFTLGPAKNLGLPVSQAWLNARKALGMTGFLFILVHALISIMLFSPAVFGKFFEEDGTLTGVAGTSMLAGVLGFVVLWGYNLSFQTYLREDKAFIGFITSRRFLIWALMLGGIHVFFMGYSGWINPAAWNGGLPPISLVAFAFFVVGYLLNLFGRK
jgi:DMSO/TMAO reductase YedYZ heme-binding membrane subunit